MYDILQNVDVNTLSIEDSNAIDGPIKYEEDSHVLKAMPNNRRIRCLQCRVFQNVLEKIGHFIVRSINDVSQKVYFQLLKGKEL